jgi:prepilin peptidase CpaA
MLEAIIFVVFPFCMAFAAVSDMLTMTIANRVSLLLIASFAVVAPLTGMDLATYGMHFAGCGMVLTVTFILFARGGLGGGDAKLLSATALWCGLSPVLMEYLITVGLLGGFLTLALVIWRNSFTAQYAGAHYPLMEKMSRADLGIPYGIALGAAGLLTAPEMPLIKWAVESVAS